MIRSSDRNVIFVLDRTLVGFAAAAYLLFLALQKLLNRFELKGPVATGVPAVVTVILFGWALWSPVVRSQETVKRFSTPTTFNLAQTWIGQNIPAKASFICDYTWLPAAVPLEMGKYTVAKGPSFLFMKPYVDYLEYDYAVSAYGSVYDNLKPIRDHELSRAMGPTSRLSTQPIEDYLARNRALMYERLPMLKLIEHLPPAQNNRVSVFNYDIEIFQVPKYPVLSFEAETFTPDAVIQEAMAKSNTAPKDGFPMYWNGAIAHTATIPRGAYDVFLRASCDVGTEELSQPAQVRVGGQTLTADLYSYDNQAYFLGTVPVVADGPVNLEVSKIGKRAIFIDKITLVKTNLDPAAVQQAALEADRFASDNLLRNGGFELGDAPLTGWSWKPAQGAQVLREVSGPVEGAASVRIDLGPEVNLAVGQTLTNVKPGGRYLLRGRIKTGGVAYFACLEVQDADRGFKAFSVQTRHVSGTTPWTVSEAEFTVPPDTTRITVFLRRPALGQGQQGSGTVWFGDCALYELK